MIAHFVAIRIQANDMRQRPEAILYPGDRGHSSLHGVAECVLPEVIHNEIVQAFAAGLNCAGHVAGLEQERVVEKTVGKIVEGGPQTAEWSPVVFDLQRVSVNR